ncbi:hypothetical protein SRABI106_03101 [Rahnella aquatilis]|nr:hypothetical protein SRABI106_03101 [Rahnella aquatilis]
MDFQLTQRLAIFDIYQLRAGFAGFKQIFTSPLPQRNQHRLQRQPFFRQHVILIRRTICRRFNLHNAFGNQRFQAGTENVLRRPQTALKFTES